MEGLALAARYRPDLILADAFMPKLDGREMCRRVKTDPETSSLKVVIMTAVYTAARYRSEAFREFQADDYLAKPLDFQEFRAILTKHLGNGGA
jgi:CheY-like chemotaxis protein